MAGPYFSQEVDPVHLGHLVIGYNHVELACVDEIQGLLRREYRGYLHGPVLFHEDLRHIKKCSLVINQEDLNHCLSLAGKMILPMHSLQAVHIS